MKRKAIFPALLCGILSAAGDFWFIRVFLTRGVPDWIWAVLMLLLPAAVAAVLLHRYSPKCVLWSLLAQCIAVIVFANPIGQLLGYRLGNIADDLFDYIGYLLYVFGWIAGVTLVQFLTLLCIRKLRK